MWKVRINEVLKGPLKIGERVEAYRLHCMHEPGSDEIVPGSRWVMSLDLRVHHGVSSWSVPICGVFALKIRGGKVEVAPESGVGLLSTVTEVRMRISRADVQVVFPDPWVRCEHGGTWPNCSPLPISAEGPPQMCIEDFSSRHAADVTPPGKVPFIPALLDWWNGVGRSNE